MISLLLLVAYCAIFFPSIVQPMLLAQFVIGIVLGFFLIFADRILHAVYISPEAEFNVLLRDQLRRSSLSGVWQMLYHAEGLQQGLLTRSVLFLLAYIALTVFVLTSTGSVLGIGMILGMGLRYSIDMWKLRSQPEVFVREFLTGVKHPFTAQDVKNIAICWVVGFIVVSTIVWL